MAGIRVVYSIDGDKKAFYERSQWAMKTNKDEIMTLRARNKELRIDLAKKKAVSTRFCSEKQSRWIPMGLTHRFVPVPLLKEAKPRLRLKNHLLHYLTFSV